MTKLFPVLLTFFVSSFGFAAPLTFDAMGVIDHAYRYADEYNIEAISSNEGMDCISSTIAGINAGRTPRGISKVYGRNYSFNDDIYTKSVIAHFCGGTGPFAENRFWD